MKRAFNNNFDFNDKMYIASRKTNRQMNLSNGKNVFVLEIHRKKDLFHFISSIRQISNKKIQAAIMEFLSGTMLPYSDNQHTTKSKEQKKNAINKTQNTKHTESKLYCIFFIFFYCENILQNK